MRKGFYMKNGKNRIVTLIFTCLLLTVLPACGAAEKDGSLTLLLEEGAGRGIADEAVPEGGLPLAGRSASEGGVPASEGGVSLPGEAARDGSVPARTAYVHICGEVENPGVYEVAEDARICDVLLLAGGFTENAATDAVNMAQKVTDGMQVVVPSVEEAAERQAIAEAEADGRVELNTATLEQLCTLPGIGETRARAILAYREEHGGFSVTEELMQVSGIKEGTFNRLRELVYIKDAK